MKNTTIRIFIFGLFFLLPGLTFSQEIRVLYKEGNRLFRLEHYRKALPYLERVVEAEPENADAIYKTGICYLHRYSKEKALDYMLKAYKLDSSKTKHIHYWLGRAYHQNYMYDKAIAEYNIYKQSLTKADMRRRDLDKYISQTNTARELTGNPENYKIVNLGPVINTLYSEHSPVSSSDDSILLFTSRRNDVTGGKEDLDGEFFEDIYRAKRQPGGEWAAPEKIPLNTSGHDASSQLFDHDSKLLLYRQTKGGDIYVTERDSATGNWKEPQKFANINTADFEADAFITADGKTAYFATNHYKKVGDLDIYYITRNEDGSWSKPMDLPGKINTSEDESAPFLTPDGKTLYFSSRGHKNMGGFDVFKSALQPDGRWSNPVNIGYPVNTPDDDVYFYLLSNGKKGYFSSYREGGFGEKDIYEVYPIPSVTIVCTFNKCVGKPREGYSYNIRSLNNTSRHVSLNGKLEQEQLELTVNANNSYRLAIYNSKDTVYSEVIEIPFTEEENTRLERHISLPCPDVPEVVTKDTVIAHKYIFRNIYFDKGRKQFSPEAEKELDLAAAVLKANPDARVMIKGYAQQGEDAALAQERARLVAEQLHARGVSNKISDTAIVGKGSGIVDRSAGLDVTFTRPVVLDLNTSIIPSSQVGKDFILRNVYFESESSALSIEAKAELDVLADILRDNPGMSLEVSGHTDAQGTEEIHPKLSQKRAQVVTDYLVQKGISKGRLDPKGYGKSQPAADNETESGRRLNRRVEFRIVKR